MKGCINPSNKPETRIHPKSSFLGIIVIIWQTASAKHPTNFSGYGGATDCLILFLLSGLTNGFLLLACFSFLAVVPSRL